jgi:hypothetical protein
MLCENAKSDGVGDVEFAEGGCGRRPTSEGRWCRGEGRGGEAEADSLGSLFLLFSIW